MEKRKHIKQHGSPKLDSKVLKKHKILNNIYSNPSNPAGFRGPYEILREIKKSKHKNLIKLKDIKDFLASKDSYTLHTKVVKKFPRRQIYAGGISQIYEADLMDIKNTKNTPFTFILVVIDIFTKYVFAKPIKNKTGQEVTKALKDIFKKSPYPLPFYLSVDKGSEFYNSTMKKFLHSKGMQIYSTENTDIKASCVERVIRTIRTRIQRWIAENDSTKFIPHLQKIIDSYNSSYHSSIKMAPKDVNGNNANDIFIAKHELNPRKKLKPKLKVGDMVRIQSYHKSKFHKAYLKRWTNEVFIVDKILKTNPITYKLIDQNQEEIIGGFYEFELNQVKPKLFEIDRIVKTKKENGEIFHLVKYVNEKKTSWIREDEILKKNMR